MGAGGCAYYSTKGPVGALRESGRTWCMDMCMHMCMHMCVHMCVHRCTCKHTSLFTNLHQVGAALAYYQSGVVIAATTLQLCLASTFVIAWLNTRCVVVFDCVLWCLTRCCDYIYCDCML